VASPAVTRVSPVHWTPLSPRDDPDLVGFLARWLTRRHGRPSSGRDHQSRTRGPSDRPPPRRLADGERITGSHLLITAGRRPSIEALDLPAAGIQASAKGIAVDARMRTTNRRVFTVGDVTGGPQFTHVASYHAGIVIRNALFRLPAKIDYRALPWVTYTDPELAQVELIEGCTPSAWVCACCGGPLWRTTAPSTRRKNMSKGCSFSHCTATVAASASARSSLCDRNRRRHLAGSCSTRRCKAKFARRGEPRHERRTARDLTNSSLRVPETPGPRAARGSDVRRADLSTMQRGHRDNSQRAFPPASCNADIASREVTSPPDPGAELQAENRGGIDRYADRSICRPGRANGDHLRWLCQLIAPSNNGSKRGQCAW
jgi:Pyridine nucleotide-disulphide oxidoreductase